jgi:hypothetical protein
LFEKHYVREAWYFAPGALLQGSYIHSSGIVLSTFIRGGKRFALLTKQGRLPCHSLSLSLHALKMREGISTGMHGEQKSEGIDRQVLMPRVQNYSPLLKFISHLFRQAYCTTSLLASLPSMLGGLYNLFSQGRFILITGLSLP